MYRVLFVCLGNICRSPLGEGILYDKVQQAGLAAVVHVDSCGTGAYHVGQPPHHESRRAARDRGLDISAQRARQVAAVDFAEFDLIVAMDRQNRHDLLALDASKPHQAKVRLFTDFVAGIADPDVPDPYFGGPEGFDEVYELIDRGCEVILAQIRQELVGRGLVTST